MPLEIWILMMTLFNVFLIVTYLYFRTLHYNTSQKFDNAVAGLDRRIKKFEHQLLNSGAGRVSSKYEDIDSEFKR